MINALLSGILIVFAGGIFSLSFSVQGLKRAVINTPIELMYRSVELVDGEIMFEKSKLNQILFNYYNGVLPRYSKEHNVELYYYNIEDESFCIEDYCSAIEITVNCKLIFDYDFTRTMYYEIRSNNG